MTSGTVESGCDVRSLMAWVGGKSLLAPTIIALFPEHLCYVEVFGGSAAVMFAKEPEKVEVYNDLNEDLVNLFLCAREHPDELCSQARLLCRSRRVFEDFQQQPGLTDIQRAVRFLYLVRSSFNNLGRVFRYGKRSAQAWFDPERVRTDVLAVHDRIAHVTIEHGDFGTIIGRYDAPTTLFYLDPPYVGCEHNYSVTFGDGDHERLAEVLAATRGKWLLSYNDHPWVRETYDWADIWQVETTYSSVIGGDRQRRQELLVANYPVTRAMRERAPRKVTKVPRRRAG